MKLYTLIFDGSPLVYRKWLRVLERSCAENSPSTPLQVIEIQDEDADILKLGRGRADNYIQNTRKTRHQRRLVEQAQDGDLLGFLDCDMLVLKDLSDIEQYDRFDLAYTMKPEGTHLRLNTGTTFVRVSDKTREFYARWEDVATKMLRDKHAHKKFREAYGGVNQCSLVYLLSMPHELRIMVLESRVWNCTQDTAASAPQLAKVCHMLRDLRRGTQSMKTRNDNPHVQWIVEQWRKYASI